MEMKLVMELDGKSYPVTVRGENSTCFVSLEGEEFALDVRRLPGSGALSMLFKTLNNRSIEAWTVLARDGYQVTVLGETFQIEVEDALRAGLKNIKGTGGDTGEETIRAPMPGVVVELKVSEGQLIAAGDPVVIVEAMKMRNEFGPKAGGTISKILVTRGQTVERGQPLAILTRGKVE